MQPLYVAAISVLRQVALCSDRHLLYVTADFMYCCVLQVMKSLNPHKDFRLWMTAEVHPKFPTILLQSSLKITFEVCCAVILSFVCV